MGTISLGRVRYQYRGIWDSATQYVYYDSVMHEGNHYVALVEEVPVGSIPSLTVGTNIWGIIALKGADGLDGEKGEKGDQGLRGLQGERGPTGPTLSITSSLTSEDENVAASAKAIYLLNEQIKTLTGLDSEEGEVTQLKQTVDNNTNNIKTLDSELDTIKSNLSSVSNNLPKQATASVAGIATLHSSKISSDTGVYSCNYTNSILDKVKPASDSEAGLIKVVSNFTTVGADSTLSTEASKNLLADVDLGNLSTIGQSKLSSLPDYTQIQVLTQNTINITKPSYVCFKLSGSYDDVTFKVLFRPTGHNSNITLASRSFSRYDMYYAEYDNTLRDSFILTDWIIVTAGTLSLYRDDVLFAWTTQVVPLA